jgi:hypothetical protein
VNALGRRRSAVNGSFYSSQHCPCSPHNQQRVRCAAHHQAQAERVRPARLALASQRVALGAHAVGGPLLVARRAAAKAMINFLLLVSRQGKTRLTKWYESYAAKEKARIVREITATVLARAPKMCNFVEWRNKKIIYKRYASLFFIVCVDAEDNELITLEMIHLYVEVLDRYFGNVCELDIIFNFHKARRPSVDAPRDTYHAGVLHPRRDLRRRRALRVVEEGGFKRLCADGRAHGGARGGQGRERVVR